MYTYAYHIYICRRVGVGRSRLHAALGWELSPALRCVLPQERMVSKAMGRLKAIMRVRMAGSADAQNSDGAVARTGGAAGTETRAHLATSGDCDPQICDPSSCANAAPGRCSPIASDGQSSPRPPSDTPGPPGSSPGDNSPGAREPPWIE